MRFPAPSSRLRALILAVVSCGIAQPLSAKPGDEVPFQLSTAHFFFGGVVLTAVNAAILYFIHRAMNSKKDQE